MPKEPSKEEIYALLKAEADAKGLVSPWRVCHKHFPGYHLRGSTIRRMVKRGRLEKVVKGLYQIKKPPKKKERPFSESERKAVEVLFKETRFGVGPRKDHRLVNPLEKIKHLFSSEKEAEDFLQRLTQSGGLSLAFIRTEAGEEIPTYDVHQKKMEEICQRLCVCPPLPDVTDPLKELDLLIEATRENITQLEKSLTEEKELLGVLEGLKTKPGATRRLIQALAGK